MNGCCWLSVLEVTKLTETLIDTVLDIEFKPRIKDVYCIVTVYKYIFLQNRDCERGYNIKIGAENSRFYISLKLRE